MCISNAEEARLSRNGWTEIFPQGVPMIYFDEGPIKIPPTVKEKEFIEWAKSKGWECEG